MWLAEIPFVRLRAGAPPDLLAGRAGFSDTVAALNAALSPPRLELDAARRLIRCGAVELRLPPSEWAMLAWFARRALAGSPPLERGGITQAAARAFLAEYESTGEDGARLTRARKDLADGMEADDFDARRGRLHQRLRRALGPAAPAYFLAPSGRRPDTAYALSLPAAAISFVSTSEVSA